VSTHFAHIETTFSFRTRILDYMWANLPIVTTDGDSFGDLVAAEGMGVAVKERDVDALAAALESMLYDPEAAAAARAAVSRVRDDFTWERALAPLVEFCKDPQVAADRAHDAAVPVGSVTAGSRPRVALSPARAREMEFHEIANSRHGVVRDVRLATWYLKQNGVSGLRDKVQNRVRIMRESKNGR
jgi:hypothetical protein